MKVVAKEIETIAWFKKTGMPIPVKFKLTDKDNKQTIKVDKVISTDEEKLAGNRMYIYRCQSIIEGNEKLYELKYEIDKCRWYLFKI